MEYAVITLGCKVNQYESSLLSELLEARGYRRTEDLTAAGLLIVNSCTVTEHSDKKAKQAVAKLRRGNPDAIIVLTGCFPQAFPEEAYLTEGADIVAGAGRRGELPELVERFIEQRKVIREVKSVPDTYEDFDVNAAIGDTDKTRAFVKIEDGCDCRCAYCVIPIARGKVRSRSIASIVAEITAQAALGHKEIVLVGVNLSCYGKDIGLRLTDAVEAACGVDGIERVRLSSLEPELMTDNDIERMKALPKLCHHFHLSLQSGCDETLRRMCRRYTAAEYKALADKLRDAFSDCSITTDIMVGFAGETQEEFGQSLSFAEEIGFARMHVFTYSIRGGTAAAKRTDHIPEEEKARRYRIMSDKAAELRKKFLAAQTGTVQTVLIQKRESPDYANGLTGNYTDVRIYGSAAKRHELIKVRITGCGEDYCTGEEIK